MGSGENLKLKFRRHYIRSVVARYNSRAARDVQMEAISRRAAATAIPISSSEGGGGSGGTGVAVRTPEFIAPSKNDARTVSVDMITPYQGRIVPYFHDTLEEIEENENNNNDNEDNNNDNDSNQKQNHTQNNYSEEEDINTNNINSSIAVDVEEKPSLSSNFFHDPKDYQSTLNSNPDRRLIIENEQKVSNLEPIIEFNDSQTDVSILDEMNISGQYIPSQKSDIETKSTQKNRKMKKKHKGKHSIHMTILRNWIKVDFFFFINPFNNNCIRCACCFTCCSSRSSLCINGKIFFPLLSVIIILLSFD